MKSVTIDRSKRLNQEPHTGHNRWHPAIPAVVEVDEGEEVVLETRAAFDLQIDDRGARLLPRARLSGLRISWLRTTLDLELVGLRSGRDLAAVGQDTWLTHSSAAEYAMTRRWASAIRAWAPWARGMTWRSHREPEGFAYVFFSDRCPDGCFEEVMDRLPVPPGDQNLDAGAARLYVEEILTAYRVALI